MEKERVFIYLIDNDYDVFKAACAYWKIQNEEVIQYDIEQNEEKDDEWRVWVYLKPYEVKDFFQILGFINACHFYGCDFSVQTDFIGMI